MYGYGYRYNSGLVIGAGGGAPFANTKSLSFDGVDDYVKIGTQSLGITAAISLSAWVKIPTTNTGGGGTNIQEVVCEDSAGGSARNWVMYWRGLATPYFTFAVFHTNGSATAINSTGIVPNDGNWHHLLGTYDGTTSVNGLKLFVDGVLNVQATTGSSGVRSSPTVSPAIGSLTNGTGWRFEGNIDEVSIFNTDQSANVSTIYNGGIPNDITSLLPLGWYRFEEGSGTTATDSGSGGNNGTLINGVAYSTNVP